MAESMHAISVPGNDCVLPQTFRELCRIDAARLKKQVQDDAWAGTENI
jgi:hypothetical protein